MALMVQCAQCRFGHVFMAENGSLVACGRFPNETRMIEEKDMTVPCYFFQTGETIFKINDIGGDSPFNKRSPEDIIKQAQEEGKEVIFDGEPIDVDYEVVEDHE